VQGIACWLLGLQCPGDVLLHLALREAFDFAAFLRKVNLDG
jgi:hypothetical protein